jgi:hypothetical protein
MNLRFDTPIAEMNICNVTPLRGTVGIGTSAKLLAPGNPGKSVIPARMKSLLGHRMPPLGTEIVDSNAVAVIEEWISQSDVCQTHPDSDGDQFHDNIDNCPLTFNPDQADSDRDGRGNVCQDLPPGC